MSNVLYFFLKVRWGFCMGDSVVMDLMVYDGLICSFIGV